MIKDWKLKMLENAIGLGIVLALIFGAIAARAEPAAKPMTVGQAMQIATGLRNLDGRMTVIKQAGGVDSTIMQPWDFGSGSLRLRIARNLSILEPVEQAAEKSRQTIVREILRKSGGTEIKAGTPELEEFQRQYADMLAQPAAGIAGLTRLKASELKLDRNEIPVTVLTALTPILDQDVGQ